MWEKLIRRSLFVSVFISGKTVQHSAPQLHTHMIDGLLRMSICIRIASLDIAS